MKKLMTVIFAIISTAAFATIRTVSNSDSAAQYRTIQAAIDASNVGDSIYVNGSPYNYAGFTLTKKLAIFGPGWSPDKDIAYVANVQGCTLRGTAVTGSELHGLVFIDNVTINDDATGINNLRLIRNKFRGNGKYVLFYYTMTNIFLQGNWFDNSFLYYGGGGTPSFFTITNNIFYASNSYSVYGFSGNNNLFDHNLWYGPFSGSTNCFGDCSALFLNNNIFIHRNAYTSNSGSTFRNNITYLTTEDNPWKSPNVDGLGNIAGTDPKMGDQLSVNNGVPNPLLNFTISSGPANNAGTDAKDIGLLFDPGSENWTRSRASNLPFVSKLTLQSNSILVGQKLKFTVDAKSN